MRKILTIILLVALSYTTKSQDLIVTAKGDSLNCFITSVKKDYISFTFKYEREIRNTLLPTAQIQDYKKNYFAIAEISPLEVKNIKSSHQKVQLGFYTGWSYLTAKITPNVTADMHQYVKELKSGFHFGGNISYFLSENMGIGLRYSMFRSSNSRNNVYIKDENTGNSFYGNIKDDITINYFGPELNLKMGNDNQKTQFFSDISIGYTGYINKSKIGQDVKLTSGTVGMEGRAGIDLGLNKNLALGFSLGYHVSVLRYINYETGTWKQTIELDKNNLENISRIDLSISLHWRK